jgi:hypothetical protein
MREATTIIFLMLQEAVVLKGACNDNESTLVRRKNATIKILYAINCNDDGNMPTIYIVLQGATTPNDG